MGVVYRRLNYFCGLCRRPADDIDHVFMLGQDLDYAVVVNTACCRIQVSARLSRLPFYLVQVPYYDCFILRCSRKVVVLVNVDAPDPFGVAMRKRVQAVARDRVPEFDRLITGARQQVVTALQVSHCAHFVFVGGERLGDLVSLQIPKLDGEIS